MAAHGRASHQAERCGERAHARAHLQALRTLLGLTAAGACRSRSGDHRHGVHDDAAAHMVLLEQREEVKIRLPAPTTRHVHTCDGEHDRSHGMGRAAEHGHTAAYGTQLPRPPARRTDAWKSRAARLLVAVGRRKKLAASVRRALSASMGSAQLQASMRMNALPVSFPVPTARKTRRCRLVGLVDWCVSPVPAELAAAICAPFPGTLPLTTCWSAVRLVGWSIG